MKMNKWEKRNVKSTIEMLNKNELLKKLEISKEELAHHITYYTDISFNTVMEDIDLVISYINEFGYLPNKQN